MCVVDNHFVFDAFLLGGFICLLGSKSTRLDYCSLSVVNFRARDLQCGYLVSLFWIIVLDYWYIALQEKATLAASNFDRILCACRQLKETIQICSNFRSFQVQWAHRVHNLPDGLRERRDGDSFALWFSPLLPHWVHYELEQEDFFMPSVQEAILHGCDNGVQH